jgi:hypothetical protein
MPYKLLKVRNTILHLLLMKKEQNFTFERISEIKRHHQVSHVQILNS